MYMVDSLTGLKRSGSFATPILYKITVVEFLRIIVKFSSQAVTLQVLSSKITNFFPYPSLDSSVGSASAWYW